ncbi:GNAT family N-acetyltransferase [Desulfoluna butyratoxydans]|uniref:Acyl-coa n-acyltransferase n=1 Tax=Desulfoluna butyratoxydans TaxID=231438 RepID=A0A4U8YH33_9BACT|nr:GNAT family N-acetyltransferase [Desulfoluna butyratoxydans]VFQ42806.1 acyl-coa n-acyltransferase [Desulfoluna butyratoxydans]
MDIRYRIMKKGDEHRACALVETVFNELVAPGYSPEGIGEFFKYASPEAMAARSDTGQVAVVAEHEGDMVGVIEMVAYSHVSLLFVGRRGQGIARELFRIALEACRSMNPELSEVTVNSSTYARAAYEKLGFTPTGPQQEKSGIVFVPMVCNVN